LHHLTQKNEGTLTILQFICIIKSIK